MEHNVERDIEISVLKKLLGRARAEDEEDSEESPFGRDREENSDHRPKGRVGISILKIVGPRKSKKSR